MSVCVNLWVCGCDCVGVWVMWVGVCHCVCVSMIAWVKMGVGVAALIDSITCVCVGRCGYDCMGVG